MANPYAPSIAKPRLAAPRDKKREDAGGIADIMRMLGTAAPGIGTAAGGAIGAALGAPAGGIGALPGAAIGSAIGGGLGGAAGSALGAGADAQTRPFEEADAEREARQQLYMQMLGAARR